MPRQSISTNNIWEQRVGFSRAVRVGHTIYTAGTVAADESGTIHGADCYAQCCYIFEKLERVLKQLGSGLPEVVKTVAYILAADDADGFTRAHFEYLGEIKPAATCVQVAGLFGEGTRVEIELTAVIGSRGQSIEQLA